MSDKLSDEELLKYFDDMCLFLANHHWTIRDERAVAIRERIKKPEVTEGFIDEKAIELYNCLYYPTFSLDQVKDFIRSLVDSIK